MNVALSETYMIVVELWVTLTVTDDIPDAGGDFSFHLKRVLESVHATVPFLKLRRLWTKGDC